MKPQASTGQTLLAAVQANREDCVARLAYADWLEEQDDPDSVRLAAYIRIECEWLSRPHGDPTFPNWLAQAIALATSGSAPLGGWEYADDLARIRQKMEAVRKADSTFALYGAGPAPHGHGYRMSPPLNESDLLRFEQSLGFPLLGDYRAFLLHIGNGPMGPYNGLEPLKLTQDLESLRRPFPFSREEIERAEAAQREKRYDEMLSFPDGQEDDGTLFLHDAGCGTYSFLVIRGESHGLMWGSGGNCELTLETDDDGQPRNFLSSYEAWLDNCLRPDVLEYYKSRQR